MTTTRMKKTRADTQQSRADGPARADGFAPLLAHPPRARGFVVHAKPVERLGYRSGTVIVRDVPGTFAPP